MGTDDRRVAVIDVGTARTKVLVSYEDDGAAKVEGFTIEASIAKELESRGAAGAAEKLGLVLDEAITRLRSLGVRRYCAIGAHVFRSAENGDLLVEKAKKHAPSFSVVSPAQEAGVFYSALLLESPPSGFVAADVGGGSVQVAWGSGVSQNCSAPVGTYTLERKFQTDLTLALHPDDRQWIDAAGEVQKLFSAQIPNSLEPSALVIGSNVMKSFFQDALVLSQVQKKPGLCFHRRDLLALAREIGRRPYSESYKLYSDNPGFLHGADKLLLIAVALMDVLRCEYAYGTNASLSKGICSLLLSDSTSLQQSGVNIGIL